MLNIKVLLTKILQNIHRLPNYYNLNGGSGNRPTSANINSDNSGSVIQFLSTSSMTTGKPYNEGNILHFNWDNSNKWASQLVIPHSSAGRIQFRTQDNGTTWGNWHDVYYDPIPISANSNLNSYHTPGTRYCSENSTVATLSNCPTSSAFFLYIEKANHPDTTSSDNYQYYIQTIKDISGKIYIRYVRCNNNTWTYGTWGNGLPYVANNLTTSSAGTYVLDAYQGKVLADKLTVNSKTYDSTYTSGCSVTRVGKVAVLKITGLKGFTTAGDYTLFTLDAEYRPDSAYTQDCVVASSSVTQCMRITINTDGTVVAHNYNERTASNGVNLRACISFICAGT